MEVDAPAAGPSGSQASGRVFLDPAGNPLRVFVEASELLHRPKVIRALKNNGAQVRHSPEEASVILVDPETSSGAQFTQDWGSEPGKIVLDVAWVRESLKRGKALLADDQWGGFCTHTPNDSVLSQNPLPTPRETPPDAPSTQAHANVQNQQMFTSPDGSQFSPGGMPPGFQYQHPQQVHNGLPNGMQVPMAALQPNPNAQVTLPAQLLAQLVGLASQQGLNPASLGIPQMGPQMPMPMMQGPVLPQGYPQQAMPFLSQPGMFTQAPFPMSQQPPTYASQPQMMNPPPPTQYGSPTPVTPDAQSSTFQMRRQSGVSDTLRGSPMEDIRSPSLKRKSPSVDRPPSSSSGRQSVLGRTESGRSVKHPRLSHTYPADEPPLPFADASPVSTKTRHDSSSAHEKKLFAKEDGEPCKFFVQVDIRPRTKIADAIKRNGGKLVPDIADADYVILGSPSTRTFEERLKQACSYEKQAVRPQWVFECVQQNAIVDLEPFSFEGMTVEKKRGRPNAMGKRLIVTGPNAPKPRAGKSDGFFLHEKDELLDDDEDDEDEEDEEAVEEEVRRVKTKGKAKATPKAKESSKKKKTEKKAEKTKTRTSQTETGVKADANPAQASERSASPQAFWRPSPPPPTRVVEHMPGRYLYTKEDHDYVDEYLPILFLRDPDMTQTAVAEKLHAKMPHHTQGSWSTFLSQAARREKIEKMKRQAQIARRKASTSGQSVSQAGNARTTPQANPPHAATTTQTPSMQTAETVDPFAILVKFFAGGGADNLADADVWRVLNQQHPEMSAAGWEAYWIEHNEAIATAVGELSGVQGDPESGGAPMQVKPEPE
ncbi:hypothetical protein PYCCODRAFT_1451721 [Trametes coccinea BRFM310]|uniref:BRCT domain-containing protein n=1 Tax=Trametes coccinea (strain BRFM310) TaxID=1353009 RepID=A0A1Y2IPV9_TRAC3|nr:hypothetical protein PYCCODRAFT_1451721 [Trametes coccinea BRFM310]